MTVVIMVVARAVAVATVTVVKTSQLLARCFAAMGQGFSSPQGARRTSQAQRLPLLEDSENQGLCVLPFCKFLTRAHSSLPSRQHMKQRGFYLDQLHAQISYNLPEAGCNGRLAEEDLTLSFLAKTSDQVYLDSPVVWHLYPSQFKMCQRGSQVVWRPPILYFLSSYALCWKKFGGRSE